MIPTRNCLSSLAVELAQVAERVRQSTVLVRGLGPRGRRDLGGGGSGVIWRSNGVVVTNAHVVRSPHAIVELSDGRVLKATVTARDAHRDLAALEVDAANLPAATVRDSNTLKVGEWVLAAGNPWGLIGALAAGIVHAVPPPHPSGRPSWIGADVRLAPGNSGGPLVDVRGEVVGINSMVARGLALAVPSNVVDHFLSRGGEGRDDPYIGVILESLPPEGRSLLVVDVSPDSPAERAGVLVGDVLVEVDGQILNGPRAMAEAIFRASPGGTLRLGLIRGGKRETCSVIVGKRSRRAEAA
jgi:serine protease Do